MYSRLPRPIQIQLLVKNRTTTPIIRLRRTLQNRRAILGLIANAPESAVASQPAPWHPLLPHVIRALARLLITAAPARIPKAGGAALSGAPTGLRNHTAPVSSALEIARAVGHLEAGGVGVAAALGDVTPRVVLSPVAADRGACGRVAFVPAALGRAADGEAAVRGCGFGRGGGLSRSGRGRGRGADARRTAVTASIPVAHVWIRIEGVADVLAGCRCCSRDVAAYGQHAACGRAAGRGRVDALARHPVVCLGGGLGAAAVRIVIVVIHWVSGGSVRRVRVVGVHEASVATAATRAYEAIAEVQGAGTVGTAVFVCGATWRAGAVRDGDFGDNGEVNVVVVAAIIIVLIIVIVVIVLVVIVLVVIVLVVIILIVIVLIIVILIVILVIVVIVPSSE
ncbi:uncharacterized protein DSM5745_09870 [Aspergillus mulundensis]|uniref:Uncharacterized protein n=1 Tax=Aspergillus mulundensis TaxID=1810919 RepID=A0A3D8QRM1_9EURO|nr:hypothetical protein DSM5745_09870 [Aspergillus mulundensis]RDW64459.1 hypothetical protein DSM5745_09870 [Aspergillus mulundensis]